MARLSRCLARDGPGDHHPDQLAGQQAQSPRGAPVRRRLGDESDEMGFPPSGEGAPGGPVGTLAVQGRPQPPQTCCRRHLTIVRPQCMTTIKQFSGAG